MMSLSDVANRSYVLRIMQPRKAYIDTHIKKSITRLFIISLVPDFIMFACALFVFILPLINFTVAATVRLFDFHIVLFQLTLLFLSLRISMIHYITSREVNTVVNYYFT